MTYSRRILHISEIGAERRLLGSLLTFILAITIFNGSFAAAVEQNTTYLPLKINSPEGLEKITLEADQALSNVLLATSFSMMNRSEAEKILDYAGPWPPKPSKLQEVAALTGLDYVAAGSLTVIGDQISIDYKVFDLLSPESPQYYYRHGESIEELSGVLSEVIHDVISYTGRDFIIASLTPSGNERIDSGAISRKIKSRPGDFYNPAALPG